MDLHLEAGERDLLVEVLTRFLGDLRLEIGNTDDYELRQELKENEATIRRLLERLATPEPVA
ncbi:MAG: hypothetical protein KatS3mg060_0122 [Dehalococcoidia bacterium]|jgi:hypothetical protein|nr:MAG: hypothetical protein KatS3mg060_0122 [Dehalococcoidia bacterium]